MQSNYYLSKVQQFIQKLLYDLIQKLNSFTSWKLLSW